MTINGINFHRILFIKNIILIGSFKKHFFLQKKKRIEPLIHYDNACNRISRRNRVLLSYIFFYSGCTFVLFLFIKQQEENFQFKNKTRTKRKGGGQ
jgi:hypothetical protein